MALRAVPPRPAAVIAPDTSTGDLAALEGRPIRSVHIAARNIFDPLPEGRLRGAYRLANLLHVRTRESTVRELLLLEAGDRWTAEHAAEAVRRLRELDFLVPERFDARLANDSVDVTVHTIDTWTTSPQFDVQSSGGTQFSTFAFSEGNVLGLGKSLAVSYHQEPAGVTRSIEWNDPALFGSRAQFDFMTSKGSSGSANHLDGGFPFYAPSTPNAAFADWRSANGIGRLYDRGVEVVDFDLHQMETDVMWGHGRRSDGTVTRWIASFHARDRHLGPSRTIATGSAAFAGDAEDLKLRRVALEGQWWRPHFIERVGVNRMTRVEDFDLGLRLALKLGVAPRAFGSTANEGYLRAAMDAGIPEEHCFGQLHASFETRYRRSVREEVERIEARWVAPLTARHTLVLAGLEAAGFEVGREFQLTAGGLTGLRAFPIHALSGRELWRLNAEDRLMGPEFWELMSIGAAAFYDAAHMTGAGAEGTGWYHDAGLGLRLGFSRSALNQVLRFDVAIPIDPMRNGGRRPVFSFGSSQAF